MATKIKLHKGVCTGCIKVQDSIVYPFFPACSVYEHVPSAYVRAMLCPFNPPVVETKKAKTKGQQKQGRNR